jgi:glutaconate CoA-transferase subunit B
MAREIPEGAVVATGAASPLAILAIAVAKATHAPHLTYLACIGSINPSVARLRLSSEDTAYLEGRCGEFTIPDLFDHARRGRIDVMFFGAAEVDPTGVTNLTGTGTLTSPKVKFPGVAGAATLRRWVRRPILVVGRQSRRNLVDKVQIASTSDPSRGTRLLTDLACFDLGASGATLIAYHPSATPEGIRERTGFDYGLAKPLEVTPLPSPESLLAIRSIDPDRIRDSLVG